MAAQQKGSSLDYSAVSYWNERYKEHFFKDDGYSYDWYFDYNAISQPIGHALRRPNVRILVVGCGASTLSIKLYDAGFTNITNIDISEVVINHNRKKYGQLEGMTYMCADVRHLDMFPESSFDVIFSKGVLDALMGGINCIDNAKMMVTELHRLLAPDGFYYEMTYGSMHARIMHLKQPYYNWRVGQYRIGTSYNMFICSKYPEGETEATMLAKTASPKEGKVASQNSGKLEVGSPKGKSRPTSPSKR